MQCKCLKEGGGFSIIAPAPFQVGPSQLDAGQLGVGALQSLQNLGGLGKVFVDLFEHGPSQMNVDLQNIVVG